MGIEHGKEQEIFKKKILSFKSIYLYLSHNQLYRLKPLSSQSSYGYNG
jgi:hypothetical protein